MSLKALRKLSSTSNTFFSESVSFSVVLYSVRRVSAWLLAPSFRACAFRKRSVSSKSEVMSA